MPSNGERSGDMFEHFGRAPPRFFSAGRIFSPHLRHRDPGPQQAPASQRPQADPDADRIAVHIPLLQGLSARLEHFEADVVSHLQGEHHPAGPGGSGHASRAVVELPASHPAHHFFGNPVAAVEASCARVGRRLIWEAGCTLAHITCRAAGAVSFAALGVWAGRAQLRGHAGLFNPGGHAHPAVGWTLLALSLPVPLLPAVGAAAGEQAAKALCWGLAPPSERAAAKRC